jgi:hypothetical protein
MEAKKEGGGLGGGGSHHGRRRELVWFGKGPAALLHEAVEGQKRGLGNPEVAALTLEFPDAPHRRRLPAELLPPHSLPHLEHILRWQSSSARELKNLHTFLHNVFAELMAMAMRVRVPVPVPVPVFPVTHPALSLCSLPASACPALARGRGLVNIRVHSAALPRTERGGVGWRRA